MNEQSVTVTITVVRKLEKRSGRFAEDEEEYEYDLWVIVAGLPAAGVKVTFECAKQTIRNTLLGIREDTI